MAPGDHGHGSIPLIHSRNMVMRTGLHTHTHTVLGNMKMNMAAYMMIKARTLLSDGNISTSDKNEDP